MLPSLLDRKATKRLQELAKEAPPGDFVEIGVYKGGSAWYLSQIAEEQLRSIYLYDTFEGIPFKDEVDTIAKGRFNDTSYETIVKLIPYAKISKGIFPQSALSMGSIAFVHFDCDQYRSIKEGVEYLLPYMVKDGIMLFDDYNWLPGATLAVDELFKKSDLIGVGAPHQNGLDRVYTIIK